MEKAITILAGLLCGCMLTAYGAVPYQTAGTVVVGTDEPASSTESAGYTWPQLSLTGYEVASGSLAANQDVVLRFFIQNNSTENQVRDLLLTFSDSRSSLYPVYGTSNQAYVDIIEPGAVATVEKEFTVAASVSEAVVLQIGMQYMGGIYGTLLSTSSSIYLPIWQASGFNAQLNIAQIAYVGEPVYLSGIISNSSTKNLTDVWVMVEGTFEGAPLKLEMGTLAPGEQQSFETTVTFSQVGAETPLTVTFEFFDEQGNQVSSEPSEYVINVMDANNAPQTQDQAGGLEGFLASIPSMGVLGVSLAAAGVLAVLMLLRGLFKRKKA